MTLDWQNGALAEGLACYCKCEYFLAHEHWESVWLQLHDPEKSFLQALIQVTAAFHHLHTGNIRGGLSLFRTISRLAFASAISAGSRGRHRTLATEHRRHRTLAGGSSSRTA